MHDDESCFGWVTWCTIISDPYCWPFQANPDPSTCLGVFGLSLYTTERDLREVFSRYGPLAGVNVVYDQRTGRSRGFAFVYFERLEDSKEVLEMLGFLFDRSDTSELQSCFQTLICFLSFYVVTFYVIVAVSSKRNPVLALIVAVGYFFFIYYLFIQLFSC